VKSYERMSPTTLFNAIFFCVAGVFILIVPIPSALKGEASLWPWPGILSFFAGFVALGASAFFFGAYRIEKRLEKEREENEAHSFTKK